MEIIGVIIAGIIIGLLGKFVAPGDKDNIPIWLTILCGIGGVIIGWFIYTAFGGNGSPGSRLGPLDRGHPGRGRPGRRGIHRHRPEHVKEPAEEVVALGRLHSVPDASVGVRPGRAAVATADTGAPVLLTSAPLCCQWVARGGLVLAVFRAWRGGCSVGSAGPGSG